MDTKNKKGKILKFKPVKITDEKFIDGLEAWLMKTVGKTWWFNFESSDSEAGNMGLSISMQVWGLKSEEEEA